MNNRSTTPSGHERLAAVERVHANCAEVATILERAARRLEPEIAALRRELARRQP